MIKPKPSQLPTRHGPPNQEKEWRAIHPSPVLPKCIECLSLVSVVNDSEYEEGLVGTTSARNQAGISGDLGINYYIQFFHSFGSFCVNRT